MQLAQVAEIKSGYPYRSKILEVPGTGVFAVQMKDVAINGGIDWERVVETETSGKRAPDWLVPGDILFSFRGNHNYAVLVDEHADKLKAVASPHFFVIRCKSDKLLPAFLVWVLNQGPLQEYFYKESTGSLTKGLRKESVAESPIVIPPLEKQRQIIQLLNVVEQERQLLKELIQNNEAMMDGIAADMLNGMK